MYNWGRIGIGSDEGYAASRDKSRAHDITLGFKIQKTNVRAQKINGNNLKTFAIVVFTFSISEKDDKKKFFEKSFLLAEIKLGIVLEMPFLTMSNADVDVQARDL